MTSLKDLNLRQIQVFHAVVEAGSISAGAVALGLVPATVSEHLSGLAAHVGGDLLRRQGRHLRPTALGQRLYAHAQRIAETLRDLSADLRSGSPPSFAEIRIGISETMPKRLSWALISVLAEAPESRHLICTEGALPDLLAQLAIHRLDLILADEPLPSGFGIRASSRLLGRSTVAWFAVGRFPKPFPRCLDQREVLLPSSETPLRRRLDRWFADQDIRPKVLMTCSDSGLLKTAGGSGIGAFPAPLILAATLKREFGARLLGSCDGVQEDAYLIHSDQSSVTEACRLIQDRASQMLMR